MSEILVMGLALAFNIVVVMWKLRHERVIDGLLDLSLLGVLMWLTAGTLTGMLVGTIASFIVSTYLLVYPVKLPHIRLPKFKLPRVRLPRINWSRLRRNKHMRTA